NSSRSSLRPVGPTPRRGRRRIVTGGIYVNILRIAIQAGPEICPSMSLRVMSLLKIPSLSRWSNELFGIFEMASKRKERQYGTSQGYFRH
ncbi:MAG: hypothetical protein V3W17_01645, partial [Desulfobacteria bacterium]